MRLKRQKISSENVREGRREDYLVPSEISGREMLTTDRILTLNWLKIVTSLNNSV